jgi:DNA-binding transcriptional LysR family regulator
MDIRDLKVFLAVAKHLNYTRAGEEIHLSQPSVSVRIRQLEEELRVRLFDRIGKRVALSEAGQLLEMHARRAVAALDDARQAIEELQGLERGSLRIGASTTPGMYLVPRIIAEFNKLHPDIAMRLSVKNTGQIEEDIINNEFDLGFVGGHLIGNDIDMLPWCIDELVLIAPPGNPLARRKNVKLSDLAKERFICREPGSASRAVVEKYLSQLNFSFEVSVELGNPEAVKQSVMGGFGIAFLSKFALEAELKAKSLAIVNIKDLRINRELRIIHRKDKHLSRAASAFIKTALKLRS